MFHGYSFAKDAIRRPYPTLIIGTAGDIVQLSISYDQLRNRLSGEETPGLRSDPAYRPDEVLARTVTFGLAINPFTGLRNAVAAASGNGGKP
jgi:hypothetical protein